MKVTIGERYLPEWFVRTCKLVNGLHEKPFRKLNDSTENSIQSKPPVRPEKICSYDPRIGFGQSFNNKKEESSKYVTLFPS